MAEPFDVVVIGAGPGGYIAAIRAAQLGFKAACIDDWKTRRRQARAGRHLHQRRLHSVEGAAAVVRELRARGPRVRRPRHRGQGPCARPGADACAQGQGRRARTTTASSTCSRRTRSRSSTASAVRRAKAATAAGRSPCPAPATQTLAAKHVIVATGSKPRALPGVAVRQRARPGQRRRAARSPAVPKTLGVVGAGVIGLEMGSVWRRLGAEVTVLEALPAFLGAADEQVAKEA